LLQKHEFAEETELSSIVVNASINPGLTNSTLHLNTTAKYGPDDTGRRRFVIKHLRVSFSTFQDRRDKEMQNGGRRKIRYLGRREFRAIPHYAF